MKKLILIALSLLVVIGLVGCSGDKDNEEETKQSIETLYPGILDKGYLITYEYSYDNHPDLDYKEYIVGKLYSDEGNLGIYTCMLYNLTSNGIEFSLHDGNPKSMYDYSDYYKDLEYANKEINAKLHLGYMNEDDDVDSETYWLDTKLDLSTYENDSTIKVVATGKANYEDSTIARTVNITLQAYDSIEEAYEVCKTIDTNNVYKD